jgi:hypothetical protein
MNIRRRSKERGDNVGCRKGWVGQTPLNEQEQGDVRSLPQEAAPPYLQQTLYGTTLQLTKVRQSQALFLSY